MLIIIITTLGTTTTRVIILHLLASFLMIIILDDDMEGQQMRAMSVIAGVERTRISSRTPTTRFVWIIISLEERSQVFRLLLMNDSESWLCVCVRMQIQTVLQSDRQSANCECEYTYAHLLFNQITKVQQLI